MMEETEIPTPTRIFVCLDEKFRFPSWWIGSKDTFLVDINSRKNNSSIFDGKREKVGETDECILRLHEIGITEIEIVDLEDPPVSTPDEFKMFISIVTEVKKGKKIKTPKKLLLEYRILPPMFV